jgi:polysaccharide biosynthesis protein PslH
LTTRILLITKTDLTKAMDGGTLRTSAIVQELRRAGYAVDWVAAKGPDSDMIRFGFRDVLCVAGIAWRTLRFGSLSIAKWFSPTAVVKIRQLVAAHNYAACIIEYSHLIPYLPLLPQPALLDMHNVESELLANYSNSAPTLLRRKLASFEARQMRRIEERIPNEISAVSVVSDHDLALIKSISKIDLTDRVFVASNGVADRGFLAEVPRRDTVVFVAHLGWQPNIDAALWLAQSVWPLVQSQMPDFVLQLVGRSPAPAVRELAGGNIQVHGDVDDVIDFVSRARVATAPLLAAGGTRLKILEGLACGTPVVATSLGALGLETLVAEGVLEIADSASEFANSLVRLAQSECRPAQARRAAEPFRWQEAISSLVSRVDVLSARGLEVGDRGADE